MLGLQRGAVILASHHPEWAALFMQEKEQLTAALGHRASDIQHVGSTAVPDLDAKPILDIAVAVADLDTVTQCVPLLQALGYAYFGDRYHTGNYFFAKGKQRNRTHYIHLALHSGPEWAAMLRFRDYLRANPAARQQYSDMKHILSEQYAADRRAYSDGKAALIQSLLHVHKRKGTHSAQLPGFNSQPLREQWEVIYSYRSNARITFRRNQQ